MWYSCENSSGVGQHVVERRGVGILFGGGGYTFVINASWGLGLITVYQCCKLVLLLWRIVLIGYCL